MTKTYINGITVTPCIRPFAGKQGNALYKKSVEWLTALTEVKITSVHDGVFFFDYNFEVENGKTFFTRTGEEVDNGFQSYFEENFEVTSFFTLEFKGEKRYYVDVKAFDDFYVGRVWHLQATNGEKVIVSIK